MKWISAKVKRKQLNGKSSNWFAWYPVLINNREWYWLCKVRRVTFYNDWNDALSHHYFEIEK